MPTGRDGRHGDSSLSKQGRLSSRIEGRKGLAIHFRLCWQATVKCRIVLALYCLHYLSLRS